MAIVPIFTGHVTEDGKLLLTPNEETYRRRYLQSLSGRDVEIVVRRKRVQRSLDMNKYWHAVPFPILAEYWGEDIETTKFLVLGECFGWREIKDGHRLPLKPSTSALTVEEGSYLTNWMPPWAMTNFGVDIPLPQKAEAA
jgi:hypothetical protein